MKIKFLKDYTVSGPRNGVHGEKIETTEYTEGKEVDLPDASANHFIKRGIAAPVKSTASKK